MAFPSEDHNLGSKEQNSRLLALPLEIRNIIYSFVLVLPLPIDLCPSQYVVVTSPAENGYFRIGGHDFDILGPSDQEQIQERRKSWFDSGTEKSRLAFRVQRDMVGLRDARTISLLRTCSQLHAEAAEYFYSRNIFRFSDYQAWQMALRFLTTLRPVTRSYIRHVQILAPFLPLSIYLHDADVGYVKNNPKLRMAKIDDEWDDDDVIHAVCNILYQEKMLRELVFILPYHYTLLGVEKNPRWIAFAKGQLWSPASKGALSGTSKNPHDLVEVTCVSVMVEWGAVLPAGTPKELLKFGWNLVCLSGSYSGRINYGKSHRAHMLWSRPLRMVQDAEVMAVPQNLTFASVQESSLQNERTQPKERTEMLLSSLKGISKGRRTLRHKVFCDNCNREHDLAPLAVDERIPENCFKTHSWYTYERWFHLGETPMPLLSEARPGEIHIKFDEEVERT